MQNPPPGPPPGGQPPYPPPGGQQPGYPPPGYQSTGGVDKKTGAILSYLLGWITGLIFLFIGKDPDVKFHAAQSTIFFGGVTVIIVVLEILSAFVGILGLLTFLLSVFTFVMWIMALIRANNTGGARFPLPLIGSFIAPYVEQLANAVN